MHTRRPPSLRHKGVRLKPPSSHSLPSHNDPLASPASNTTLITHNRSKSGKFKKSSRMVCLLIPVVVVAFLLWIQVQAIFSIHKANNENDKDEADAWKVFVQAQSIIKNDTALSKWTSGLRHVPKES